MVASDFNDLPSKITYFVLHLEEGAIVPREYFEGAILPRLFALLSHKENWPSLNWSLGVWRLNLDLSCPAANVAERWRPVLIVLFFYLFLILYCIVDIFPFV